MEYLQSELLDEACDANWYSYLDKEAALQTPNPEAALAYLC